MGDAPTPDELRASIGEHGDREIWTAIRNLDHAIADAIARLDSLSGQLMEHHTNSEVFLEVLKETHTERLRSTTPVQRSVGPKMRRAFEGLVREKA
jgi:hypothetical protein